MFFYNYELIIGLVPTILIVTNKVQIAGTTTPILGLLCGLRLACEAFVMYGVAKS